MIGSSMWRFFLLNFGQLRLQLADLPELAKFLQKLFQNFFFALLLFSLIFLDINFHLLSLPTNFTLLSVNSVDH